MAKQNRKQQRTIRHQRIRKTIYGTTEIPRMSVCCTNNNIHIQFIDDINGKTITATSSIEPEFRKELNGKRPTVEQSKTLAGTAAKRALDSKIDKAVVDRGGFKYHGRVQAIADTMRENGIKI